MSTNSVHTASNHRSEESAFPWNLVAGFVLSLVMTVATLWFTIGHHMHGGPLVFIILLLAVMQVAVQLFLFMHLTESDGTRAHIWTILLGFFFTFVVVAASIWIMSCDSQVA